MPDFIAFVLLGLIAGSVSGLIGIGGGIIIVPALVLIFGLSQKEAQGTTLALLVPPIGVLAAYTYYKRGLVDTKIALLVCLGFLIGGLIGARLTTRLSNRIVVRLFGISLLLISLKIILTR